MSGADPRAAMMPGPMLVPNIFPNAGVPGMFSNQLRLGVTLTDFTIVFGVGEDTPAGPNIRDRVAIHLAPAMLKQLLAHLEMAISAYEEAIGTIPIPARLNEYTEILRKTLIENLRGRLAGPSDAEIAAMTSAR
ncbi:MAG: DUF3467 domain-containing protein [Rhodospirillales bacterium]|nr:DUF3467 domain-containing protein [Rhodospirillales bacterium]